MVVSAVLCGCLPVLFARTASASSSLLDDGAALYFQKCSLCHGKDGRGTPAWKAKGQPDFTDAKYQGSVTDQQISTSIHDGKGKYMPAFKGKLSDQQISSLVTQVRAFGNRK
jgi:cytochrome c6